MAKITQEMLDRIMTPDGPTKKLVALRQETGDPQPGIWHRNFNAVKNIADAHGKPFVAMWTNGDLCGFCRRFTDNILDPQFLEWMKGSDCYFWLGGSMDEENQREGAGWKFCIDSGAVGYFPFVAVQQREGGTVTHQFFGAGHDFDQRKQAPEGVEPTLAKFREVLSGPPQDLDAVKAENERRRREYEAKQKAAGNHPHLKVLQQIAQLVAPFAPAKPAPTEVPADLTLVRFVRDLDQQRRLRIVQAIADNGGHCACQKDRTPDTVCLCKAFRETGVCACGLFERYKP